MHPNLLSPRDLQLPKLITSRQPLKLLQILNQERDIAVQYTPTSTFINNSGTKVTANPAISIVKKMKQLDNMKDSLRLIL